MMINVIENLSGIKDYKTNQETKGYFVVKLFKDKEFSKNTIVELKRQIKI